MFNKSWITSHQAFNTRQIVTLNFHWLAITCLLLGQACHKQFGWPVQVLVYFGRLGPFPPHHHHAPSPLPPLMRFSEGAMNAILERLMCSLLFTRGCGENASFSLWERKNEKISKGGIESALWSFFLGGKSWLTSSMGCESFTVMYSINDLTGPLAFSDEW